MRFRNPTNGYEEEIDSPFLWSFLLGPFYLGFKGVWGWAILGFLIAALTFGLWWFVFPFFAEEIIRKHYLQRGWQEIDPPEESTAPSKPKRSRREEDEHQRKLAEARKKMGW